MIYGDNNEEFSYSEIYEALEMVWDAEPLDTEYYNVWEGELTNQWIDSGNRVVTNVRKRTFKNVKNKDSKCFDFDNFVEING